MRIDRKRVCSILSTAIMLAVAVGLEGCSVSSTVAPTAPSAQHFSARIIGGVQPISNGTIQLYTPGTNGYGSASTALLNQVVTTDANGYFSITGDYSCPSASTPVYLVATGGNPGLAPGTNNNAIALMALLGQCGSLTPTSFFNIGERTTVAAVWALAPFMVDYAHIGTSPGNVQGLLNAFAVAQNLVDVHTGVAPGTAPAIATVPTAEINTLADILTSCVNSNGSTVSTAGCGRLFTAATPVGGVAPFDTAAAALNIARNPGHNSSALFSCLPSSPPYQPTLSIAPGDWTLAVDYVSPAFNVPSDLAIDSQGNAWVLSGSSNSSSISILNTTGITATFAQPGVTLGHLALDPFDDPWLTNNAGSSVLELTSSGAHASSNPFSGAGIQGPGALAFDGSGNVWTVNNGPTVSKLSANGAPLSVPSGYSTGGASGPAALALDTSGNVWIANSSSNTVSVLSSSGAPLPGSPYSGGGMSGPFALAIDSTGGAWVANRTGSNLSRLSFDGSPIAGSPYFGAGLNAPIDIALDGLDNVWLANSGSSSVSEFLSTGRAQSGNVGYGSAALASPFRLVIDGSGNVWVANLGSATVGTGTITQIVGAAAPVVTPASVAVQNNALDQRP
ncbi:MAG: NHL repeat-containing protein [Edaphobacter sp.]